MSTDRAGQLFRALFAFALLTAVWTLVLVTKGGFVVHLGPVRVSSRNPINPALLTFACVAFLAWHPAGRRVLYDVWSWLLASQRRAAPVAPFIVAALGIALDLVQWIDGLPFWADEEMIAINVRDRTLSDLGGTLWLGQAAPFGWLAVQRCIALTLGTGERALRLVPTLFGIATVLTAVWIGRRWMGALGATALVVACSISQQLSHFRFEAKHYTADVFWALLLPAVAAWAIEARGSGERARRARIWWGAAAVGHWFGFGALLVVPALALTMFWVLYRRDGRRSAIAFSVAGLLWVASVGLHYQLSLGATHGSHYMYEYWRTEFPPPSSGPVAIVRWLFDRLEPLARDPGGTEVWAVLWVSAALGLAVSRSGILGILFAMLPLSGFTFAALGAVPLYGRFCLWIVPALYVGSALLLDRVTRSMRRVPSQVVWMRLAFSVVALLVYAGEYRLYADIVRRGWIDIEIPSPGHKHSLDDRAAVRWLMQRRQPGDAIMTTSGAWPAVWWYGAIRPPDEHGEGSRLADGSAMYEISRAPSTADCLAPLRNLAKNHRRALVYLGFERGYEHLVVGSLDELGAITAVARFTDIGSVLVVEFGAPASRKALVPARRRTPEQVARDGCLAVQTARRW